MSAVPPSVEADLIPSYPPLQDASRVDQTSFDISDRSGDSAPIQLDADPRQVAQALEEFLNTSTWDEKRQVLEREQTLLLSQTALALLAENLEQASDNKDEPRTGMLSLHLTLLKVSRTASIEEAWSVFEEARRALGQIGMEEGGDGEEAQNPDLHEVTRALTAFIKTWPWEQKWSILEREQKLLLSNTALILLNEVRNAHKNAGGAGTDQKRSAEREKMLRRLGWILWRARQVGVHAAVAKFEGLRLAAKHALDERVPVSPLADTALTWFNTGRSREARRYLEAHPELLGEEIELLMQMAIYESLGQHDAEQDTRDTMSILQEARALGGDVQAIRTAYVNSYGGFTLDLPAWLEDDLRHFGALQRSGRADETAAKRVEILREILARALEDPLVPQPALAELHDHVARALEEDPHCDRALALEDALVELRKALAIYTLADYPRFYAATANNLAIIYGHRLAGNPRENLEQAIIFYEEALKVRTLADFPLEYARTQLNLCSAYAGRIAGTREDNMEAAIHSAKEALRVFTITDFPSLYATARSNLATAYQGRIKGDTEDNLETAIRHHEEALKIRTLADFPLQYAQTQNNLGNIYQRRVAGNPQDNVEAAIHCFEEALKVKTRAAFPRDYANTQSNLGNAYLRRIAGNRRDNLEVAIHCYEEALSIRTLTDLPVEHRDTSLNLGWLAFDALVTEAEEHGSHEDVQRAYEIADRAYTQARIAQIELGWREGDAQGRAQLRGSRESVRDLHARHAYCLWRLGRPREAVVALEAGRVQALADAQALANVSFEGVDPADAIAFQQAQRDEETARARGDLSGVRQAREALITARERIREKGHLDFLPGEPNYAEITRALTPTQVALYLTTCEKGGLAFLIPPATVDRTRSDPIVLDLPTLTSEVVDDWLVRPDAENYVAGGFRHALGRKALPLLITWLQRQGRAELKRLLMLPLKVVADELPESLKTVRTALDRMAEVWVAEATQLATGDEQERETAHLLESRLAQALGEALYTPTIFRDLSWFFMEAELETLLPKLATIVMQPVRTWLDAQGLDDSDQQIALIACGRLGALPLHAALVRDAQRQARPFQETSELSYQASARILAVANERVKDMSKQGAWFTVGNPLPTNAHPLEWAEAEAEAIADLATRTGRAGSKALLTHEATKTAVLTLLGEIRSGSPGAWLDIASHGHADPGDLGKCYLLLGGYDAKGNQETLTLTELQRSRLLEGVRCFNASGCTTAVGDLDVAPDELSSFAAGILQAGAASAIATQWSVDDRATFLLMLRFAQIVVGQPGITPARALRDAAAWLRQATWDDIEAMARKGLRKLRPIRPSKRSDRSMIRGIAQTSRDIRFSAETGLGVLAEMAPSRLGRERPFAHPIYWAAAIAFGA